VVISLCVLVSAMLFSLPLLAESQVSYSTFFGGSGADNITDIAIDSEGHIYITGHTNSDNLPIQNALQDSRAAADDIFVARFSPAGDTLEFCTYFGGNGTDQATGMTLDVDGNIWVCGWTTSNDLRTVLPMQAQNSGDEDAFVLCLSDDGDSIILSSYVGGIGDDRAVDIATDPTGSVCFVGSTSSSDFPSANALYYDLNGSEADAFLYKIDTPSLTPRFATYFGGTGTDRAVGVVVDDDASIYICGWTNSTDLPMVGASQDSPAGGYDIWVAKIDSVNSMLIGSTYWGGEEDDIPRGMSFTRSGAVSIVGSTYSPNYPVFLALQDSCQSCPDSPDGFVTTFDRMSGAVQFSTYLGGSSGADEVRGVTADEENRIIVDGWTEADDFPTALPVQGKAAGLRECFVSIISSDGGSCQFGTFYGGTGDDEAHAVVSVSGAVVIAGKTGSSDFPLQNPWLHEYAGGSSDGFVARLDVESDPSLCGDYDGSGDLNVADVVHLVQFIFQHGDSLHDGHGGDVDCDGMPTVTDAVFMVAYIFAHGDPPCGLCK